MTKTEFKLNGSRQKLNNLPSLPSLNMNNVLIKHSHSSKSLACVCSMAVLLSRAHKRRSREICLRSARTSSEARKNEQQSCKKNKNRLPVFVALSAAAPFNSF